MKFTKYLIFVVTIILIMAFNTKVYAFAEQGKVGDTGYCYYKNGENAVMVGFTKALEGPEVEPNSGATTPMHSAKVVIFQYGGKDVGNKTVRTVENLTSYTSSSFDTDVIDTKAINENYPKGCPTAITVNRGWLGGYHVNLSTSGIPVVKQSEFLDYIPCKEGGCNFGTPVKLVCSGLEKDSIFGNPYNAGVKDSTTGEYTTPPSTAYMIKRILNAARIAVIAIVMVLGITDIAKAVIASKEEEMKKAQSTFVKRLAACILVFLVPIFINTIMNTAYDMWESEGYGTCTFEQVVGYGTTYHPANEDGGHSGVSGKF